MWVIATLGPHWNVQIMDSARLGVVTGGPFRFIRHPNYVAVFLELLALPLVHGAWLTALLGGACHVWVLAHRIRAEETALLAHASTGSVMGGKPRFFPRLLPAVAAVSSDMSAGRRGDRRRRRRGRSRRWPSCWGGPGARSSCTSSSVSPGRRPAPRGSCRPAWRCWTAWGCCRRSPAPPLAGIRYLGAGDRQIEAVFPPGPRRPGPRPGPAPCPPGRAAVRHRAGTTADVTAHEGVAVEAPLWNTGGCAGVIVDGQPRRAALVVAADGPRSALRRRLDSTRRPRAARGSACGATTGWPAGTPAPTHVEIFCTTGQGGCEGARAVRDAAARPARSRWPCWPSGRTSIANADTFFARAVAGKPRLRALLEGAEPVSELAGRTPLAGRARRGWVPGLVLLGDAAAALDPVTGAGMAQALISAERLASTLVRWRPELGRAELDPSDDVLAEFDRQRRGLYREAAVLSSLVLSLVRSPALAQGAFRVLGRWPALFTHLVGVAAGTRQLLWS